MKIEDIKRILVIGAGTMGRQISVQCAWHGYDVVLYDIDQEILEKGLSQIKKLFKFFVTGGRLSQDQADKAFSKITITKDPQEAARGIEIVSESVPENPDLKAHVFAQFNKLCSDHTIFTTNTSLLVPSLFADATGRPDRFAALHFHDVRVTSIVDIMPHPGTSPETIELIKEFAKSIGQIAIVLQRENHGYVFNAMLSQLFVSALTLATRGVATIEDIDRAWMGVMNTAIGPFGIMDQIGITTVWSIADFWAKKNKDPQAKTNADFLKQYIDKGHLGAKTKQGFYSYPDAAYTKPGFLKGE